MSLVRKGFTLIELIVVIVIIGILAAVAAVAYNAFIGNANTAAAVAEASDQAKVVQAQSALGEWDPTTAVTGSVDPADDHAGYDAITVTKGQCIVTVTGVDTDPTPAFAADTTPGAPFTVVKGANCS